ncbi:hypothetical protein [Brevibacillus laterosporus]|nr:hypothetical protein [Brevibacillus laterosporus]
MNQRSSIMINNKKSAIRVISSVQTNRESLSYCAYASQYASPK